MLDSARLQFSSDRAPISAAKLKKNHYIHKNLSLETLAKPKRIVKTNINKMFGMLFGVCLFVYINLIWLRFYTICVCVCFFCVRLTIRFENTEKKSEVSRLTGCQPMEIIWNGKSAACELLPDKGKCSQSVCVCAGKYFDLNCNLIKAIETWKHTKRDNKQYNNS